MNTKETYYFLVAPALYIFGHQIIIVQIALWTLFDLPMFHYPIFKIETCVAAGISFLSFGLMFILPLIWKSWSEPYYFGNQMSVLTKALLLDLSIFYINFTPLCY